MTTKILHVSDTLHDSRAQDENAEFGGLSFAVNRAIEEEVDAFLHTGNLFQRPTVETDTIEGIEQPFEQLSEEGITSLAVAGKRDVGGEINPFEYLAKQGLLRRIDSEPVLINDEVLFWGKAHTANEEFEEIVTDETQTFTEEMKDEYAYKILCLHQPIWPPADKEAAAVTAYELMHGTESWVDTVACGSSIQRDTWYSDQVDFHVMYPGTTNPGYTPKEKSPSGFLYTVEDGEQMTKRTVLLDGDEINNEVNQIKQFLEGYEQAELAEVGDKTLTDIYALTAEAKSVMESRRKDVRDVFTDRIETNETVSGMFGEVANREYTRRSLKSEEEVLEVLQSHGIEAEDVMTRELDSDKIEALVEQEDIEEGEIYETSVRKSARKKQIDIGRTSQQVGK